MTAEQKQWLCEHYADTKNDDILAYLGVSMTAMQRIKRDLGLHKSAEYMRKAQQHAVACSVKVTKGRPCHPNSAAAMRKYGKRFEKGVNLLELLGEEREHARRLKSGASLRETIRKERMRIKWGLPQRTKLRLNEPDRGRISARYFLRKRGYHVARGANVAYYDAATRRGKRIERWAKKVNIDIKPIAS